VSRNLSDFGTEAWPLRPSSLGKLLECPMSVALDLISDSNGGAQTGSVLHAGVEQFHRTLNEEEGLRALIEAAKSFPLAAVAKAQGWYEKYVADAKNREAQVTHLEHPVSVWYNGVYIAGTLDQLRFEDGVYRVWDVKSGTYLKPEGMRKAYAAQQAAYVLAARATLGLDVRPGGIIRVHGYDMKRGEVFVEMNEKTVADCEALLAPVVPIVRAVRAGARDFRPSDDACRFCPARSLQLPECTRV